MNHLMIDANIEIDKVIIYISKQNLGLNKKNWLVGFFLHRFYKRQFIVTDCAGLGICQNSLQN